MAPKAVQERYSPDNPFAPTGAQGPVYSPDNPFAPEADARRAVEQLGSSPTLPAAADAAAALRPGRQQFLKPIGPPPHEGDSAEHVAPQDIVVPAKRPRRLTSPLLPTATATPAAPGPRSYEPKDPGHGVSRSWGDGEPPQKSGWNLAIPQESVEDYLARHLSGESTDALDQTLQAELAHDPSLLKRTAFTTGSMLAHPAQTAIGVAAAPFIAAYTLGQFTRQEVAKTAGKRVLEDPAMTPGGKPIVEPPEGWVTPPKDEISPRDAAFAAGQLLVPALVGKVLPYLDMIFGRTMARAAVKAVESGKSPNQALLAGYAARTAAHAAGGSAIGAVYAPDDPEMGGLLGAALAGATALKGKPSVTRTTDTRVAGDVVPNERALSAGKRQVASARVAEKPPMPLDRDYSHETIDETIAKHRVDGLVPPSAAEAPLEMKRAPDAVTADVAPRPVETKPEMAVPAVAPIVPPVVVPSAATPVTPKVPESPVAPTASPATRTTSSDVPPSVLAVPPTVPSADLPDDAIAKIAKVHQLEPLVQRSIEANGDSPAVARRALVDRYRTLTTGDARLSREQARATIESELPPPVPKPEKPSKVESHADTASEVRREGGDGSPGEGEAGRVRPPAVRTDARENADGGAEQAAAQAAPTDEARPLELKDRPAVTGVEGAKGETFLSTGQKIGTRYRVVEATDLQPSHSPETFAANPNYPAGVQGREYAGTRGEAARGQVMTGALRPEVVLDRGSGTTDGPPVITHHGIVVAGNDRSMRIVRASTMSPDQFGKYRTELEARAGDFGVDPAATREMKSPVLVRQIDDAFVDVNDPAKLGELNRASDTAPTKTKDQVTAAMGRADAMRKASGALSHLAETMDSESTVRDYLSTSHGRDFVRELVKDGVIASQELPAFVDRATNTVHAEGKQKLEDILYAAAIGNADVMARAPSGVLKKIGPAIPAIVAANQVAGYELAPVLQGALDIHAGAAAMRAETGSGARSIADYLGQGDMFGRSHDENAAAFALYLEGHKASDVTKAIREYAKASGAASRASASEDMFGHEPEPAESARRRLFRPGPDRVAEPQGSWDPAQADLFKKAIADPTGPDARALNRDEAERAYGSVLGMQRVAEELRPSALALQSLEERARQIGAASDVQVIVAGTDVSTPEKLRAAATVLRHPRAEHLSYYLRDRATGEMLEHVIMTSGQLNWSELPYDQVVEQIQERVKANGGSKAVVAGLLHNHPSGRIDPSRPDLAATYHLRTLLNVRGITLEGHMVIDHDEGTWIVAQDNAVATTRVQVPGVDQNGWKTAPEMGQAKLRPEALAALAQSVADPTAVTLLFLDYTRSAVAAGPAPRRISLEELATFIGEQYLALAAHEVVIVAPAADAQRIAQAAKSARLAGKAWGEYVLDVLEVTPNGIHVPIVKSLTSRGEFPGPDDAWKEGHEGRAPLGSAYRVVSDGRGATAVRDGERVTEPDLFGEPTDDEIVPKQEGLFAGQNGPQRSLAETEMAARSEIARLRQELDLLDGKDRFGRATEDLKRRQAARRREILTRLAPLEKLVNRGKAISTDEMRSHIAAGGPQNALFEKGSAFTPLPIAVALEDLPYAEAYRAYQWNSMSPDRRARQDQESYIAHMRAVYDSLAQLASTPELQEKLAAELTRYRDGYLSRLRGLLAATSRTASPMVTGPANFPTARNRKANDREATVRSEFIDWSKRAQSAMWKKLAPLGEGGRISSDDPNAIEALTAKVEKAKALQDRMKAANAILRRTGITVDGAVTDLKALGFTADEARDVVSPSQSWMTPGFPSYRMQNNLAEVKRLEVRIADLSARRSMATSETAFDGGRVVQNVEDNRLQIHFAVKPDGEMITKLKGSGFRWAPSVGAWQRQLTGNARYAASQILDIKIPAPSTAVGATSVTQPEPVTPTLPEPEEVSPPRFDDAGQGILMEKPTAWDANLFGEQPTPEKPATGIKNAVSAEERAKLGMVERVAPEPRTQDEMYEAGKMLAEKDPGAMDRLLKELRDDPEKIVGTKVEAGLLLKKRVDLDNELVALVAAKDAAVAGQNDGAERVARLQLAAKREEIKEFVKLAERTGTATGRALAARRMMSALDYSLSHMETMAEAAKGAPLTDDELNRVKALYDELQTRLAATEKDVSEARDRAANAEADLHHAQLRAEAMKPLMDRVVTRLDSSAAAARARLKARGLRAMSGIDPELLADYAVLGAIELARGVGRFADWSSRMTQQFGDGISPHLREIFDASNTRLNTEIRATKSTEPQVKQPAGKKITEDVDPRDQLLGKMKERMESDSADVSELRPYLRELALEHIREGITEREAVLSALHRDVQEIDPLVTREEVRDALSGYGDFRPLDKSADKVRLREIQAESQKLAQLEALERKEAPRATGFERQAPSEEVRRLTKQVNEAKKAAGIQTDMDDATRLRSALASAKTRTRNAINDLQAEIDTGRRMVRGKSVLVPDAELEVLKRQLAGLREVERQVFQKPGMTDEQRLAMAIRLMKGTVSHWTERVERARKGDFAPMDAPRTLGSPDLEALKAQAKAAREEYAELRSLDPAEQMAASARANQQYRARLARREADLLGRIARQDFSPAPVRRGTMLDSESLQKKAAVEEVKQRYQAELRKFEQAHRTTAEKNVDRWVAWVRFGALSWPTVIAKLTSVALTRVLTTPAADLVATGVARALPRLARGAPRYGTASAGAALQAEAAAVTAMFTEGLRSSGRMLSNKRSRLELVHGRDTAPPEWKDYMGRLHGALKEPIKEAEYARSLHRRTYAAALGGENIADPAVQLRLSTEAYQDAERAISMNRNVVTDAWNAALRNLVQKDKATGKPSPVGVLLRTAAKTEVPVVTAPTNVVLEASEIIAGLPIGAARAAWAYAHGIEDLKPVERDSIIRMIAKGSIGLAIMALYFYKAQKKRDEQGVEFGGFYEPGERRPKTDVKADAVRVGQAEIPSTYLHNPYFMAGQFAATMARVAPSKRKKSDEDPVGYGSALLAASIGLLDETPLLGSLVDEVRQIKDPKQRDQFIDQRISSVLVPGAVQWIASKTDTVRRKPANLKEAFEQKIPGLRTRVSENPQNAVDERRTLRSQAREGSVSIDSIQRLVKTQRLTPDQAEPIITAAVDKMYDDVRAGKMTRDDINQLVRSGTLSPARAYQLFLAAKATAGTGTLRLKRRVDSLDAQHARRLIRVPPP